MCPHPPREDILESEVDNAVEGLCLAQPLSDFYMRTKQVPLSARVSIQSHLTPNATALTQVDRNGDTVDQICWSQLKEYLTATAILLRKAGVSAGDKVVSAFPNSICSIVSTLAIWRVGAVVVPIKPHVPDVASPLPRLNIPYKCALGYWPGSLAERLRDIALPHESLDVEYGLPNPYAVLSTGGSVGRPRPVAQCGLLWGRFVQPPPHLRHGHGLRLGQTQLVNLPLWHGLAFSHAFVYGMAHGHTLVLLEEFRAHGALRAIERLGINYIPTVPRAMTRMARASIFSKVSLESVEMLLYGGMPCSDQTRFRWMERLGAERMTEAYGATDFNITCTIRGDEWLKRRGAVGIPADGDISVRDERGNACQPRELGRLFARPRDRSSADSPISELSPTGDIGYFDQDGYLFVTGRASAVFAVRGTNVHPEFVEDVLSSCPGVDDVAVLALNDGPGNLEVGALIVGIADISDLIQWCLRRLPMEHLPRVYRFIDRIPRTDVGKIDRRFLAEAWDMGRS